MPKRPLGSYPDEHGIAGNRIRQPKPSPDPTGFKDPVTDQKLGNTLDLPTGQAVEPNVTLAEVYGSAGAAKEAAIPAAGGGVPFGGGHGQRDGAGDAVASGRQDGERLQRSECGRRAVVFFHLGDVVYYFGEATYYYDQFYEPYRDYPAPILAIAGNHDGVVYANDPAATLQAFLRTSARRRRRSRRIQEGCCGRR